MAYVVMAYIVMAGEDAVADRPHEFWRRRVMALYSYGLYSYGINIYGLYSYGINSYGIYSYGPI